MTKVALVGAEAAADVLALVHAGFGAREMLDPPSTALDETAATIAAALESNGGLLASDDDGPVGSVIFESRGELLGLRRVAVHPDAQGRGVARALVRHAERVAADRGCAGLRLAARAELPRMVRFWRHLGYVETDRDGSMISLVKLLPVVVATRSAEEARALGLRLASMLRAGDLVILSGDLGAGKTTLTQGIGAGLRVRGDVTSPTFVISRVHPSLGDGPALVHVDAYRLGGGSAATGAHIGELDDLDLEASLDDSVTVVEWGEGVAEGLADDRLEVRISRAHGDEPTAGPAAEAGPDDDLRTVTVIPVGARWLDARLGAVLTAPLA